MTLENDLLTHINEKEKSCNDQLENYASIKKLIPTLDLDTATWNVSIEPYAEDRASLRPIDITRRGSLFGTIRLAEAEYITVNSEAEISRRIFNHEEPSELYSGGKLNGVYEVKLREGDIELLIPDATVQNFAYGANSKQHSKMGFQG